MLAIVFATRGGVSFDDVLQRRAALDAFVATHFVTAIALYVGAFALASALSLPLSVYLAPLGGYLFGVPFGFAAAWAGAMGGATLVFLAARSTFAEALRARAAPWLRRFEDGFRDNGFNYLLALRLTPIIPFWILNLAPAFLNVRLRDFVLATAIGIVPMWLVLVSVGAALHRALLAGASLDPAAATRDMLLSPLMLSVLGGLIALALAPVALKALRKR